MAGASMEGEDNPVPINVTPLIDIIFCLCVFFMISFKFKQIEGKFDAWLPKNKGAQGMPLDAVIQEIRVALFWDEEHQRVIRKFGVRKDLEDQQLQDLIQASFADFKKINKPDVPLTIDGDIRVPWADVISVINIGKRAGIDKVEFAFGAPPPKK
jgi:biopolymer transport protein ExbD